MPDATLILIAVVAASLLTVLAVKLIDRLHRKDVESEARTILERTEQEVANRKKEAELEIKEAMIQQKADLDRETMKAREDIRERERVLDRRQESLDLKADQILKQERSVEQTQRRLSEKLSDTDRLNQELAKLQDMQRQALHEATGLSREEAEKKLLEMLERELQQESGALILKHKKQLDETCKEAGREMLLTALQRYAAAHTAESTTSTVGIPNDEMKGRIIGREGRNIRAFEKETGVDVIIDDTPGVVVVSGFDPVRREVARVSLNKLIADGRIHPSRIEEVVAETARKPTNSFADRGKKPVTKSTYRACRNG